MQAYGSWNPIFLNMTNASLPILRRDPDNCINMIDDDDSDFCYGTATGKAATWFQIDFGNAVTILAFVVYNRMDLDCNYRLQCGSTCDPCECTDADAGVSCGALLRVGFFPCSTVYWDLDNCTANPVCAVFN